MFINPNTDVIALYTTVEQCDEATAYMQALKDDLVYDQTVNDHRSTNSVENATKVDADLTAAKASKTSYQTLIAGLPVGSPILQQFEDEVTKLNYKIFNLEGRAARLGGTALMKYKIINDGHNSKITEINSILADIVVKRATL